MKSKLLQLQVQAKDFPGHRVIDDMAFTLDRHEIVSLVGPSGCGKSTLLRIISGLDKKYQGQVLINDKPPHVHSPDVGFVFQEPRLLPWLTVAQNVGFDQGEKGATSELTKELLAEVGLSDFANAYPKELSGGMAQRAAIARGLFTHPDLLLLDEPFSAVDALTRMRLQDLLLSIATKHQTTILLVTHDVQEAAFLSDRVLILASNPGRIVGEVDITLPRPRDRNNPLITQKQTEILNLLHHSQHSDLKVAPAVSDSARSEYGFVNYQLAI